MSNFSTSLCFTRPSVNQMTEDRQQRSRPVGPVPLAPQTRTLKAESQTLCIVKEKAGGKMRFLCPQRKAYKRQQMFEIKSIQKQATDVWNCLKSHKILTATDLTALISFLLSKFFRILLISVKGRLLLYLMSLLQIPVKKREVNRNKQKKPFVSVHTNQKSH